MPIRNLRIRNKIIAPIRYITGKFCENFNKDCQMTINEEL